MDRGVSRFDLYTEVRRDSFEQLLFAPYKSSILVVLSSYRDKISANGNWKSLFTFQDPPRTNSLRRATRSSIPGNPGFRFSAFSYSPSAASG